MDGRRERKMKKTKLTADELAKIKSDAYKKGIVDGKTEALVPNMFFEVTFPDGVSHFGAIMLDDKTHRCYIGKVTYEGGKAIWTVIQA